MCLPFPGDQEINSISSSFPFAQARDKGGADDDRGTQHSSRSIQRPTVVNYNNSKCAGWPRARECSPLCCSGGGGVAGGADEVNHDQDLGVQIVAAEAEVEVKDQATWVKEQAS